MPIVEVMVGGFTEGCACNCRCLVVCFDDGAGRGDDMRELSLSKSRFRPSQHAAGKRKPCTATGGIGRQAEPGF